MSQLSVISDRGESLGSILNPRQTLRRFWLNRDLIRQLTWRDFKTNSQGTTFGFWWSVFYPLLMLSVYTFVFSIIFKNRWGEFAAAQNRFGFSMALFCGLILHTVFSESLSRSTVLIVSNQAYVKKVVFPLEILPVVVLLTALLNAGISMLILFGGLLLSVHTLPVTACAFPLVVLPLMMLSLGASWFVAALAVYIRDIGQVVNVLLQMLFFLTPIFYPVSAMPPNLRFMIHLNPLAVIVINGRRTLIGGQWPEWPFLAGVTLASLFVMLLGYIWFMKTKRGFADVL